MNKKNVLIVAACMAVLAFACKKDKSNPSTPGTNMGIVYKLTHDDVTTWISVKSSCISYSWPADRRFVFKLADHSYSTYPVCDTCKNPPSIDMGTWKVSDDGDSLFMKSNNNDSRNFEFVNPTMFNVDLKHTNQGSDCLLSCRIK